MPPPPSFRRKKVCGVQWLQTPTQRKVVTLSPLQNSTSSIRRKVLLLRFAQLTFLDLLCSFCNGFGFVRANLHKFQAAVISRGQIFPPRACEPNCQGAFLALAEIYDKYIRACEAGNSNEENWDFYRTEIYLHTLIRRYIDVRYGDIWPIYQSCKAGK